MDGAFKLPDDVFEGRHFIRWVPALPFAGKEGYFGYGAWAEVGRTAFDRYRDISFRAASPEPPGNGTIANHFNSQPRAYGSLVSILFGPKNERPMLSSIAPDSELFLDQANGRSAERYHQIRVDEQMT